MRAVAILFAGLFLLVGCGAFTEHRVGIVDGKLSACPQWPRCVSSQAEDPDKAIDAFQLAISPEQAWEGAVKAVSAMPRTTIIEQNDHYLHAEIKSPWRVYTDDLELLAYPDEAVIHVRSSARIGYYDFNVNRDRVNDLRKTLEQESVLQQP